MGFWPILKKELTLYFILPSTWLILSIFLLLSGYFFYTNLIQFNWFNAQGTAGVVSGMWQYYFNDLRLMLTFVLPLFTMRLFSEEKKLGTIELLTTYPVRDGDIIIGKYLACLILFSIMIGLTTIYAVMLGVIWDFRETAGIMSGYAGIFLLGSSLITCGLFISSLTENQAVSAMGTMGIFIFFWFLTWNEMIGSEQVIMILKRISLFDRVFDFFKGVINTRDIVFFVLVSVYFIFLTRLSLRTREWKGIK